VTRPRTTNRLTRTLGAAALIAAAVSASACNGSPDATQTPSTTVPSSTPTPTPSTPAPPALPAEAKGLTVESADAFTRFYLQLLEHAQATGNTTSLKAWSDAGCIGCGQAIRHIDSVEGSGGSYSGDFAYNGVQISKVRLNQKKAAEVRLSASVGKHTLVPSPGATPTIYPGEKVSWVLTLVARRGQWIAYELEDEKG